MVVRVRIVRFYAHVLVDASACLYSCLYVVRAYVVRLDPHLLVHQFVLFVCLFVRECLLLSVYSASVHFWCTRLFARLRLAVCLSARILSVA